jgi:hypothetical protein
MQLAAQSDFLAIRAMRPCRNSRGFFLLTALRLPRLPRGAAGDRPLLSVLAENSETSSSIGNACPRTSSRKIDSAKPRVIGTRRHLSFFVFPSHLDRFAEKEQPHCKQN